ncbi:MAG: PH domain-containing protein [Chloroflexota bacterium]|nr:MAG: PH domain-containing protein [Chloroflexota bacterium]
MTDDIQDQAQEFPRSVYHSKRDTWLVAVLWAVILFCVASMVYVFYTVTSIVAIIAQESLFLILVAFCLSILRNTYYVLEGDRLLIRSGWFRWRTKLADIEEVIPSRKAWSSAALSLDRLYVRHRNLRSSSYISPEDKEGFMRDLASRSPALVYQDGKVLRIRDDESDAADTETTG